MSNLRFDFGWFVICFGMAMGTGVVLSPIAVGVAGFYSFILSIILAYLGVYILQKLYMLTLFASKESKTYSELVVSLLGEKIGVFLSIIYFIMMLIYTLIYAEVIAKAIAAYFVSFGISSSEKHIESNVIYAFCLMATLIFLGVKSKKMLVNIATLLSALLVAALLVTSFALIPFWKFTNLTSVLPAHEFVKNSAVLLPFTLTSVIFINTLSAMVMSYKKQYSNENIEYAKNKAIKTMKMTFIVLVIVIGFYSISFALVIPHDEAVKASLDNETAFFLIERLGQTNTLLRTCGAVIVFCGVLAPFFSILIAMKESIVGMFKIFLVKFNKSHVITDKQLSVIATFIIFILTSIAIISQMSVFVLLPFTGVMTAIIGCFIPSILIFKKPELSKYKGTPIYFAILLGVVLVVSPFLTMLL